MKEAELPGIRTLLNPPMLAIARIGFARDGSPPLLSEAATSGLFARRGLLTLLKWRDADSAVSSLRNGSYIITSSLADRSYILSDRKTRIQARSNLQSYMDFSHPRHRGRQQGVL